MLWMLRNVVGDDVFKRAIQTYVVRYRNGLVTTPDLVRVFEDVSGKTLGWFFDEWVYGAGHPEFEVSFSWDEDAGAARIAVKQTQRIEGDTHLFRMPIRVAFGQPGRKQPVMETIDVGARGEAEDGFSVSLTRRPTWVRFDHENRVLKTLKFERPEELLLAQLREDEMTGRIDAVEARPQGHPDRGRGADGDLAQGHLLGCPGGRRDGARETRSPAARTALLEALEHPESKVRAAAARALGGWRGDDEVGRALARGDPEGPLLLCRRRRRRSPRPHPRSQRRHRAQEGAPARLPEGDHPDLGAGRAGGAGGRATAARDPGDGAPRPPPARPLGRPLTCRRLALNLPPEQRRPVREAAEETLRDPSTSPAAAPSRPSGDWATPVPSEPSSCRRSATSRAPSVTRRESRSRTCAPGAAVKTPSRTCATRSTRLRRSSDEPALAAGEAGARSQALR